MCTHKHHTHTHTITHTHTCILLHTCTITRHYTRTNTHSHHHTHAAPHTPPYNTTRRCIHAPATHTYTHSYTHAGAPMTFMHHTHIFVPHTIAMYFNKSIIFTKIIDFTFIYQHYLFSNGAFWVDPMVEWRCAWMFALNPAFESCRCHDLLFFPNLQILRV
jgi:hypothetical protein